MRNGAIDIAGQVFGRLTAIEYVGPAPRERGALWQFSCACGGQKTTLSSPVRRGHITGCGKCHTPRRDARQPGARARTQKERGIWYGMKQRCLCKTHKDFRDYGGRGITMCDRWLASFESFVADMGPRPSAHHSIDRIDNDGGYTCGKCPQCVAKGAPANCRWATQREQNRNTSTNMVIEFRGERRCLMEWAEVTGLGRSTIHARLRSGWSAERALLTPAAFKAKPGEGKCPRRRYSSKAKMLAAGSRDGDRVTLAVESLA